MALTAWLSVVRRWVSEEDHEMAQMKTYRVLQPLSHSGHGPGDTVKLTARQAQYLLASGHIEPADAEPAPKARGKTAKEAKA